MGLTRKVDGEWVLQPPLFASLGVNGQLERPHVVVRDERYYLFLSTHAFTFADPLTGPDGLYGFVSENLRGRYEPLNESGLVLGNPAVAPIQLFSFIVLALSAVSSKPAEPAKSRYSSPVAGSRKNQGSRKM